MIRFADISMKPPFNRKSLYFGPRLKSETVKSIKRGVVGLKKNITKGKKKPLTMPQKKQLTEIQKMIKRLGAKPIGARMRPRKGRAESKLK